MEAYKKELRSRIVIGRLFALMVIAVGIYDTFFAEGVVEDHITSFQKGMLTGIAFVAIFYVIRSQAMLKDEHKLRLGYYKEYDERARLIQSKAGLPMILYTSAIMIIVGSLIARSYPSAFIALVVAGVGQLLVAGLTKAVLSRRM